MSWAQWQLTRRIKILSIKFRKTIVQRSWDALPMTDAVISRINTLDGDQPGQLTFTDRNGHLVGDVPILGVPLEATTTL